MTPESVRPDEVVAGRIAGKILCHDILTVGEGGRVKLPKGRVLAPGDADALQAYSGEIHVLAVDSTDVHEDEASVRLARAIAGEGVRMAGPVESQTHLRAARRGLVRVCPDGLEAMNRLPDISVFTLYDGQPVDVDKAVGATKVTPLAIPADVLFEAEEIARRSHPVLQVKPFLGGSVGILVRDRLTGRARDRFEHAIQTKVQWFGSPVAGIRYLPENVDAIVNALHEFVRGGVAVVLAAGVNSTDPLDLTLQALDRAGARTERRGVPAHPGSTCWLAYCGETPIFGLALCGMFSQTTALDLLLPRFLAGERVSAEHIAGYGHGGLLGKEMAFRFPAYGT